MKCPKCGTANTEEDQYCLACNQSLVSASSLPEPTSPISADTTKEDVKTSRLAIAAVVLGILGIVMYEIPYGIIGGIGMSFGIFALTKIDQSQGRLRGKGLAITGIIISVISAIISGSTVW